METEPNQASGVAESSPTVETANDAAASASELANKHRKQRSDKGKPRGSRSVKNESETAPNAPIDPRVAQLNLDLVKKAVASITNAADAFVGRAAFNKATRLGCEKEVAAEFGNSASLSPNEIEIISECSATIVARSEFLIKHAPEAMLLCVVVAYGVRVASTFHRLDVLETKLKKQVEAAKDKI